MSPRALAVGLTATVACVAACTSGNQTAQTEQPTVVIVTATDYGFQAPDTIPAGFTTFRLVNRGEQFHMALLVRLEEDKTAQDYLQAYGEAFRVRGPRPSWARRVGGPGAVDPHGTSNATQHLEPGSYVWTCLVDVPDGIPHMMRGMAKPFIVRASRAIPITRSAPEASVVLRLLDYSFSLSNPLSAC